MIVRTLTLAGGLAGGVAFSQFPEFSQQYLQRLAGARDALAVVVSDFDTSAAAEGLSREDALESLSGSAFLERRQTDMRRTIARYHQISFYLSDLQGASALGRAKQAYRFNDTEVMQETWQDFRPAVPFTAEGVFFAAGGFAMGSLLISLLLGGVSLAFRRART